MLNNNYSNFAFIKEVFYLKIDFQINIMKLIFQAIKK